ncbi:MAG TPA: sensor histidine kinase [Paraburkholderia sp.]
MNKMSLSASTCETALAREQAARVADCSSPESRAFVLDESATNLRELVDGVIALLMPFATRQGSRLGASVDQTVAETILADSTRLGQLFFHLLSRTIQLGTHGEIALRVWAEPLNLGSQRIFASVVAAGDTRAPAAQQSLFRPRIDVAEPLADERLGSADVSLQLCQLLAQSMQGELSVANGSAAGVRANFNAPFTVDQWRASVEPAPGSAQAPLFTQAAQPGDASASASFEPFERRYLDALSEEGIDLRAFLDDWRHAMDDDLEHLRALNLQGQTDRLPALLHRLSGAVGLVGAHGLTEALRRASASPLEHSAASIDALAERVRTLVAQLKTAPDLHRSTAR